MNKILVITPVHHIHGVVKVLEKCGDVTYLENPKPKTVLNCIKDFDALFTNPNKSNIFIDRDLINAAKKLKVICTASTGTNHIQKEYAKEKNIAVLSLTEEREVINRISSTAEHAFALMLAALRKIPQSFDFVKSGKWDYEPFIGRQLDHLNIGIVGFGRLGSLFGQYASAFKSNIMVYDPYKNIDQSFVKQVKLNDLLKYSDVITVHVHVTKETYQMVNNSWFEKMRSNVLLINTSRGDIFNENELIKFLSCNPDAYYATDVLAEEITSKWDNKLIKYARENKQVLITPHIGGMTIEGQMIAYNHAAKMLNEYFALV